MKRGLDDPSQSGFRAFVDLAYPMHTQLQLLMHKPRPGPSESHSGSTEGAEYLIGGAHALAFHARPRATKDLDLFIRPTKRNAARVVRAIQNFFGGSAPSYVSIDPNGSDARIQPPALIA